jgi:uncharacterized protein YndB with AHSA1/START domain
MTVDQQSPRKVTLSTPSDVEIRMERIFDAPRDEVFATYTDPTLIPEWWGPGTSVEHMDVRTGGSWRFRAGGRSGTEDLVFEGEYREVAPPERIVQTFTMDTPYGPRTHVERIEFEAVGDRTRLVHTSTFESTEGRDGVLHFGAEAGANYTWGRLDALIARRAGA